MNNYQVVLMPQAIMDLDNIAYYVANILNSPQAARRLKRQLVSAALSLDKNPYCAPLIADQTFPTAIRKLIVTNYLILFSVDETTKQINILSIHNRLLKRLQ
jgi:plasmid stabilization system protein ParE